MKKFSRELKNPARRAPPEDLERYLRSRKDPQEFALENRSLIQIGIRRWNLRAAGAPLEDIEQECMISLMMDAKTWDPAKGSFATHAISGMRRARRALEQSNSNIHFEARLRARIGKYLKWNRESPSSPIEEFASFMDIPVSEAREVAEAALFFQNSKHPKDGSALMYAERASNDTGDGSASPYILVGDVDRKRMRMERFLNAHTSCELDSLRKRVMGVVGSLKEEEKAVLTLHFGLNGEEPAGLKEIAGLLDIPREKVKERLKKALKKLRNAAEEAGMRKDLLESIPD